MATNNCIFFKNSFFLSLKKRHGYSSSVVPGSLVRLYHQNKHKNKMKSQERKVISFLTLSEIAVYTTSSSKLVWQATTLTSIMLPDNNNNNNNDKRKKKNSDKQQHQIQKNCRDATFSGCARMDACTACFNGCLMLRCH